MTKSQIHRTNQVDNQVVAFKKIAKKFNKKGIKLYEIDNEFGCFISTLKTIITCPITNLNDFPDPKYRENVLNSAGFSKTQEGYWVIRKLKK